MVNEFVGLIHVGDFAALVPVDADVTGLTATVVNAAGTVLGSDTISVTVTPPTTAPVLSFSPSPATGAAPLTVDFTLTSLKPITQIELDLEGDGTVDFQGATLEGLTFEYVNPGLFFPEVTVTDDAGGTDTAVAIVQVLDGTDLDNLLQAKWSGMKDALRTGNIATALSFIAEDSRDKYQEIFTLVSSALPTIDSVLTDINLLIVEGNQAEFEMLRVSDGVEVSFYILFVRDGSGIWRLRTF